jgi:transcriptional pleiotropic regulator of transition state genes
MQTTGVIRPVDRMGRVVIPKEIRRQLKIENDKDSFEIYMDGDRVILKKFAPTCIFCGNPLNTVSLNGHNVCVNCIDKLNGMKDQAD